jgi:FdhD protein
MKPIEELQAVKWKENKHEVIDTAVPREAAVTLYLNDEELATLLVTPQKLKELAVGFLFSEGILKKLKDLKKVLVDNKKGIIWVETERKTYLGKLIHKRFLTSGCGKGTSFSDISGIKEIKKLDSKIKVAADKIAELMKTMFAQAELYKAAGGIHSSALSDGDKIISMSEDIGRHNTFDKILGECLLQGIDTEDKILLTTGRISSEMLLKAVKTGIPILVSRSSPTNLAVEAAQELGVTLVGYARAGSVRVYANDWRII